MSAFYPGQPVRILWSENWPELAGQEGRIIGPSTLPGRWEVAPKSWSSSWAPRLGDRCAIIFAPADDQLRPILPPGLESPAEIAALYEPEDAIA